MPQKGYKVGQGNPNESPFVDNLAYKLANDLPLNLQEPITFADFEVTEPEFKEYQKMFWFFNRDHRNLEWRFATRHFPSVNGQYDVIRVWKIPSDGKNIEQ